MQGEERYRSNTGRTAQYRPTTNRRIHTFRGKGCCTMANEMRRSTQNVDTDSKKCSHDLTYGEERYGRLQGFHNQTFPCGQRKNTTSWLLANKTRYNKPQ